MRAARGSQARQVLPKEAPRCGGGAKPRRRGHAQGARAPAEQRQEETNKKGHKHSLFALRADFLHLIRAERQQLWCTERTITSREASAGSPPSPIRQARPITRSKWWNAPGDRWRIGKLSGRRCPRARARPAARHTPANIQKRGGGTGPVGSRGQRWSCKGPRDTPRSRRKSQDSPHYWLKRSLEGRVKSPMGRCHQEFVTSEGKLDGLLARPGGHVYQDLARSVPELHCW
ncbi:unnamed protein product [Prorocentrum cordatum]|uniref:Uncharacterized protein n=1 Tax=Prorocentrum cordatum TaxID=2364126 RepID=A0ABN9QFK6_9DINO|nr:unnamed protein product [Polarella glacialis]